MKLPVSWVTINERSPLCVWKTSTFPERIIINPGVASPTRASASPAANERTSPKRHTRSISSGSREGNIWARRVAMID
jgi:hypothetical protein